MDIDNTLWLVIGLIIGNSMDYVREDKERIVKKKEKIYLLLFRLYPIIFIIHIFGYCIYGIIYKLLLKYFNGLPIEVVWCICTAVACIVLFWFCYLYYDNLIYRLSPKKELTWFKRYCSICGLFFLSLTLYYVTPNHPQKVFGIATILFCIVCLFYLRILYRYCSVTKRGIQKALFQIINSFYTKIISTSKKIRVLFKAKSFCYIFQKICCENCERDCQKDKKQNIKQSTE